LQIGNVKSINRVILELKEDNTALRLSTWFDDYDDAIAKSIPLMKDSVKTQKIISIELRRNYRKEDKKIKTFHKKEGTSNNSKVDYIFRSKEQIQM
jgi:hypothetical protein